MSFAVTAGVVGAGASLAGGMMQSKAAEGAAGMSAEQAAANAAALQAAQTQADGLYTRSGAKAESLLRGAYQGAREAMRPYDYLGRQGSNELAAYLGIVPAYGPAKPTAPKKVYEKPKKGKADPQGFAEYGAAGKTTRQKGYDTPDGKRPNFKPGGRALTKQSAKEQKNYTNALAEWEAGRAAFNAAHAGSSDFGGYFKPYTHADLMADPVYATELAENVRAWDQSAASRGSLMSGNTVAGLRELTAAGIERGFGRDWNQRERKYGAYNALQNMGLGVRSGLADARMQTANARANAGLQTGANRANSLYNFTNAWAGQNQAAADARASGRLAQGTAMGNAFGNVGQMAMLHGLGAFGNKKSGTPSTPLTPRPSMQPLTGGNQFDGYGWFK